MIEIKGITSPILLDERGRKHQRARVTLTG
jgi:hypothetical protein